MSDWQEDDVSMSLIQPVNTVDEEDEEDQEYYDEQISPSVDSTSEERKSPMGRGVMESPNALVLREKTYVQ